MKVLFLGGNGNISWHCATKAQQAGHDVYILNRGLTVKGRRACPKNVKQIYADIRDIDSIKNTLKNNTFDVVADFICYTPEQAFIDINLFGNLTKQFIFISSAGNYQRPCAYPIVESSELYNPNWEYAQNKIDCEQVFLSAYEKNGFPVTIVRPGHTYDTIMPDAVGNGDWTTAKRILEGKPIILHDTGNSVWTVTHSEDFAEAFIYLLGNTSTIGESYHITSDEWLTWKEMAKITSTALGITDPKFLYIPSNKIAQLNPKLGQGLLGHKAWCDIYDNSKIKQIAKGWKAKISFEQGIKRTINWLQEDKNRQRINLELDLFLDNLYKEIL